MDARQPASWDHLSALMLRHNPLVQALFGELVKMCGPQHVDKNGIHNILTNARVLVFGIYVSILLLPCLWAGCLGLDVEKMMPTNEDLHSRLFYGSASLQPPPHQQKEGGNVTPHF